MDPLHVSNYALNVDDNPSDLIMLSALTECEGFIPIQTDNGFEALEKLHEFDFKILIIDLQMPKMSGIDLIKRIRRTDKFKTLPIIVMSARSEAKDVKLALQSGANDYIIKPADPMIFKEKFNRFVGDKKESWAEYPLSSTSPESLGYIKRSFRMLSVSEVGVTFHVEQPVPLGKSEEIETPLFQKFGITSISIIINECVESGSKYKICASFTGLTDSDRKKLRLLCRELWNNNQNRTA